MMPWPIFGLVSFAVVLPFAAYGVSVLRVQAEKRRELPRWRSLATSQAGTLVERGRSVELRLRQGSVIATRHERPRHWGGVRWARWETVVSVPTPEHWPASIELYGRRAISEIVTTRRRVPIEPTFDRVVLVRDPDGDAAEPARARLSDPALREGIANVLSAAPRMWVAQGQIRCRIPGLASPRMVESSLLAARKLGQHLTRA